MIGCETAGSPERARAMSRVRSREGRCILYHSCIQVIAQSVDLSAWQRLQEFGMPSSFVSCGSGTVNPWSRRGSRAM